MGSSPTPGARSEALFRERRDRLYRACTARGFTERGRELVEVLVEQVTVYVPA